MEEKVIKKIVSGGQTGVDRAALDFALDNNIVCGGWCPKGRKAEDGVINEKYPLMETNTNVYSERTELNVRDSDATLIIYTDQLEGGTALTLDLAKQYKKEYFLVNMDNDLDQKSFKNWLGAYKIKVLNIAGPRESLKPGFIYKQSKQVLGELFG